MATGRSLVASCVLLLLHDTSGSRGISHALLPGLRGDLWAPEAPALQRTPVLRSASMRLRGGLPDEAQPQGAADKPGQRDSASDADSAAVSCLPAAQGEGQHGDPAVSGALKRVPTPTCLEMAAIDAVENNQGVPGPGGATRYAWDPKRRTWLLFKRPDEDLSIESLRGRWNFPSEDCLTFRPRRPDKWQSVDWAPGLAGWVEFFFWITPCFNQILFLWRGLFPCAVCGLARSKHPCPSEREADAAFWQAVRFRDVELAVRLVRGGVECEPGGANWCLLAWLQANYCSDAFSHLRHLDQAKAHEHLWKPGPRSPGWTGIHVPYI